jgi:hypothetical protein
MMQVFNEINSRKLGAHDYNVFESFFNNWLFIGIIIFTIVVQTVLVQYGGTPLRCWPLTIEQHAICIGLGVFSLINGTLYLLVPLLVYLLLSKLGVIVKLLLPSSWFNRLGLKEEPMTEEESEAAFTTTFRKSFRASHRRSGTERGVQQS